MIADASLWGQLKDLVQNGVFIVNNAGAPTSGTSGTGVNICGPGSILIDTTNKIVYVNTNTKASPTWTAVASTGGSTITNSTIGTTNTVTLKDTLFSVVDDGDVTKIVKLQLSGLTTGTTRTLTVPDADLTLVGTGT